MNSKMMTICIVGLLILTKQSLMAQQNDFSETVLNNLLEYSTDKADLDKAELIEQLRYYSTHKINLNHTCKEELQKLYLLSPLQINAIINHLTQTGEMIDLLELQTLDGFDEQKIKHLNYFIHTMPNNSTVSQRLTSQQEILIRAEQPFTTSKGYNLPDSDIQKFKGSPQSLLLRYRLRLGDRLFLGMNVKKNEGSPFLKSQLDFSAFNLFIRKETGIIRKLTIGNFGLQYGQGLSLWSGFGIGKTPNMFGISRIGEGLMYYTPNNSVNGLKGIAGTLQFGQWSITPFLSYKNMAANMTLVNNTIGFSSLYTTDLYRNDAENDKRAQLQQLVYGITNQYERPTWSIGTTFHKLSWSQPMLIQEADIYKKFTFQGKNLATISVYYHWYHNNWYAFGEIAKNGFDGGLASLNGILINLSSRVSIGILHRNYTPNYHAFLNNALSENTQSNNEKGIYSHIQMKLNSQWEWSGYIDLFTFPWLKYGINTPSSGHEYVSQWIYKHTNLFSALFRYRLKQTPTNIASLLAPIDATKQNYRVEIEYSLSKKIKFTHRVEIVQYHTENEPETFGYALIQDCEYPNILQQLNAGFRIAVFDTDSYQTGIYTLERNVWYAYDMNLLQHKGVRFYVNANYRASKHTYLWLKYAIIKYQNQDNIGTGLDSIETNTKSDITIQVSLRF